MNTLLVEDDHGMQQLFLAMLNIWKFDVTAFSNGEQVLSWIESIDDSVEPYTLPHLAIIEMRLPGDISGDLIVRRLRRHPLLRNIAIALTTTYRLPAQEEMLFYQIGADRIIYKPLPPMSTLRNILLDMIASRRGAGFSPVTL